MKERIGVIDLGTNTFHLLVAEVSQGKVTIIYRDRQAVRLGKGGINRGVILDDAINRALQCIKLFKIKLDEEKVERVMAIGTSALRSAANEEVFLKLIKDETGIDIQVISGDQEAEYIYNGVRSALDLGPAASLLVDIGGGSVEFIIANKDRIFWKSSIDIGAQRMLERYHRHDPIRPAELAALQAHYRSELLPLQKAMEEFKPETLAGSSGTFDTLSEIHCQRNAVLYSAAQPETMLTLESFLVIHAELIRKNRSERMKIPGMIEMRVEMIVVASCLIHYLVEQFHFKTIRVSTHALKEGVLAKMTGNA